MATIGTTSRPAYVYDQETDTWVPVGVGPHTHENFVTATTIDAKGDLLAGLSPDTVGRLPIGANGTLLVADSTETLGMAWRNTITIASGTTVPLTIQNNGTGNSFVVNDEASDASPFVIDAAGLVGFGITTPIYPVHQSGTSAPNFGADTYGTTGPAYLGRRARGTAASPTATLANDGINAFVARGYGTTGFGTINVAAILLNAEADFTDISQPTFIAFGTTPVNSVTRSERMRIDSNGNIGIGTSTPGSARLSIVGPSGGTALALTDNVNSTFAIKTEAPGNLLTQEVFGGATMRWVTNGAERMRVDPSGNFGIGVNSPAYRLQVNNPVAAAASDALVIQNSGVNALGHTAGIRFRYISAEPAAVRAVLTDATSGAGALGFFTSPDGTGANLTERMRINSNGNIGVGWTGDNNWGFGVNNSTAGAGAFLSTTNGNITCGLFDATRSDYGNTILQTQAARSNNTAFSFFRGISNTSASADTEFSLRGDGNAFADGSWSGGGADYAEYFEWVDGNPNNEDRRGYSVSLIEDKIKIAEDGDIIIGVISANPSVVGNHAANKWDKKYLKDQFNSYIRDESGDRVINPDFDPDEEYISREERPEWAMVGLLGKICILKGQKTSSQWIKMKEINEDVEEWLIK